MNTSDTILIDSGRRAGKLNEVHEKLKELQLGKIAVIGAGSSIGKSVLTNAIRHLDAEVILIDDQFPNERIMNLEELAQHELKKSEKELEKLLNSFTQVNHIDVPYHHLDRSKFTKPIVRESPKISRNAPCSCGSGKKNKRCCDK